MGILALLDAKGIHYTHKGGDEYGIVCPTQHLHAGGRDNNPSFNVNIVKQLAHCLACGFKLNQAGLYKWLVGDELNEFTLKGVNIRAGLKRLEDQGSLPLVKEEQEDFMFPIGEPWSEDGYRGISLETYQKLGAVKVTRGRYANRICLPIRVNGNLIGVDGRYLGDTKADKVPKYLRNYNSSCKTDWLFPFDIVKAQKPKMILLGEGIFHAIRALDLDYAGLCFFGVNNFSHNKILMLLATGASEICFIKDNDKAGEQAAQRICAALLPWFKVTIGDTEYVNDGQDLGDYSKELLDYCVEHRKKPVVPVCLKKDWLFDVKKVVGEKCKEFACVFNRYGKCNNTVFGGK